MNNVFNFEFSDLNEQLKTRVALTITQKWISKISEFTKCCVSNFAKYICCQHSQILNAREFVIRFIDTEFYLFCYL